MGVAVLPRIRSSQQIGSWFMSCLYLSRHSNVAAAFPTAPTCARDTSGGHVQESQEFGNWFLELLESFLAFALCFVKVDLNREKAYMQLLLLCRSLSTVSAFCKHILLRPQMLSTRQETTLAKIYLLHAGTTMTTMTSVSTSLPRSTFDQRDDIACV